MSISVRNASGEYVVVRTNSELTEEHFLFPGLSGEKGVRLFGDGLKIASVWTNTSVACDAMVSLALAGWIEQYRDELIAFGNDPEAVDTLLKTMTVFSQDPARSQEATLLDWYGKPEEMPDWFKAAGSG